MMFAPLRLQSVATVWFTGSLCSYTVASLAAVSGGELINLVVVVVVVIVVSRQVVRFRKNISRLYELIIIFVFVDHWMSY